ncbi:MAG: M23 family metallopeptidase [Actinomycetota bacterium]|nr:M23 family metallopeptidase [Actinomycetota bacterium]
MRKITTYLAAGSVLAAGSLFVGAAPAARGDIGFGTWSWPVVGPVIRGFEPPPTPYSAGHRGIDIAVPFGTPIHAPADGVVTFAGFVAGSLFATIDHGDGVRSSYSWLSAVMVKKGDQLSRGQVFARTGHGHPDVPTPHLHFGVRINGDYVDPMLFLGSGSLVNIVHLADLMPRSEARADGEAASLWSGAGGHGSAAGTRPFRRQATAPRPRPRGGGLVLLPARAPPRPDS